MRKAVGFLGRGDSLPEGVGYTLKRRLLGPPMVNEELSEQRLSNVAALGVLAPDGISSSAYGTEEILIELLKGGLGVTAFTLILPLTGVVLFVMALVVLSYREVVTVYTTAGGSYVVARDNFGPKIAQIAAVALLIDYIVTVAVQCSAGTAALDSAFPAIGNVVPITVGIVVILIYGNLRGIREAGSYFAFPTYFFVTMMGATVIYGYVKKFNGSLHHIAQPAVHLMVKGQLGHKGTGILMGLAFLTLLRAYANGGSSLTGLEAISNGVASFRRPESPNARKTLVTMSCILAFLLL